MLLPSSRWAGFLHPILKCMGICYGVLPPYLSDIPASKDGIRGQQEMVLEETQWGRRSMAVVFHLLHLHGPSGMAEWGPYLLCQLFTAKLTTPSTSQGSQLPWPSMSPIHVTPDWWFRGVPLPLSSPPIWWGRRWPLVLTPVACPGLNPQGLVPPHWTLCFL